MNYKLFFLSVILAACSVNNISAQEWIQSTNAQGLVVMAAEDYSSYRPGSGEKEGETFTLASSLAGFIGNGYMQANMAAGDGSIENAENVNIKLSYDIEFTHTGTHYIWAHVFFLVLPKIHFSLEWMER